MLYQTRVLDTSFSPEKLENTRYNRKKMGFNLRDAADALEKLKDSIATVKGETDWSRGLKKISSKTWASLGININELNTIFQNIDKAVARLEKIAKDADRSSNRMLNASKRAELNVPTSKIGVVNKVKREEAKSDLMKQKNAWKLASMNKREADKNGWVYSNNEPEELEKAKRFLEAEKKQLKSEKRKERRLARRNG